MDGRTGRSTDVMKAIVAFSNNVCLPKERLRLVLDEYKYTVTFIIRRVI